MQYHLDTIPVWESMEWKNECPLCGLARKTELEVVERALGASVMEPNERIKVNKHGMCRQHHQMLFAQQNRLGHALLMDSRGKELRAALKPLAQKAKDASGVKGSLFAKNLPNESLIDALHELTCHCVVCETIATHMARYRYTFLHLWKTDATFQAAWRNSKGVCLHHTKELLQSAREHLSRQKQSEFADEALTHLINQLTQDGEDLDWFTRKFDYRNQDQPWGNSKTALERMVNRERGWCLGDEPYPRKK